MARRTRRDLTNKKVRKIVKNKHRETSPQTRHGYPPVKKSSFLKISLYIVLAGIIIFGIYKVSETVDFAAFFAADSSSQNIVKTEAQQVGGTKPNQDKEAETAVENTLEPVDQLIQVEVLNGCGVSGLANVTTNYLRKTERIDVVYKGNYKNFNLEKSKVIDRSGNMERALDIARVLGIDKSSVSSEVDLNKQLAATIVIGKDYKKLDPFKKE